MKTPEQVVADTWALGEYEPSLGVMLREDEIAEVIANRDAEWATALAHAEGRIEKLRQALLSIRLGGFDAFDRNRAKAALAADDDAAKVGK